MSKGRFSDPQKEYRFEVFNGMKFFESRYMAQRYLDEVVLKSDLVKDLCSGHVPMDASQKYSFAIFKREYRYCIVSMQVI